MWPTWMINKSIMPLENYINSFSHLRTDVNHHRWTAATQYCAPHKPFLLISILDLFAQGSFQTNLIELTPELGDIFSRYWSMIMPLYQRGNIALPFFHLKSSGFWHLLPRPESELSLAATRQVDTLSQLNKLILGASLDDELFQLMTIEESRNALRTSLIKTYL